MEYLRSITSNNKDRYDLLSGSVTFDLDCDPGARLHEDFTRSLQTKAADSPMYQFWNSYLTMVRMFIRATQESNWKSHVAALRCMLPDFFSLWKSVCDMG